MANKYLLSCSAAEVIKFKLLNTMNTYIGQTQNDVNRVLT